MSDEDGFEAEFPWGVLLLTDSASREMIPTWASPEVTVAVAQTALVVRVRHADDGPVDVRAVHSASAVRGSLVWDGRISVHSGVLRSPTPWVNSRSTFQLSGPTFGYGSSPMIRTRPRK